MLIRTFLTSILFSLVSLLLSREVTFYLASLSSYHPSIHPGKKMSCPTNISISYSWSGTLIGPENHASAVSAGEDSITAQTIRATGVNLSKYNFVSIICFLQSAGTSSIMTHNLKISLHYGLISMLSINCCPKLAHSGSILARGVSLFQSVFDGVSQHSSSYQCSFSVLRQSRLIKRSIGFSNRSYFPSNNLSYSFGSLKVRLDSNLLNIWH